MESGRCVVCGSQRITKRDICKRCRMMGHVVEEEEE